MEQMVEAAPGLAELFDEVSIDPMVIFDDTWREEFVTHLAALNVGATLLLDLKPPSSMSSVSVPAGKMARTVQEAVSLYAEAVDDIDADKLLTANEKIILATQYVNETTDALERLCS